MDKNTLIRDIKNLGNISEETKKLYKDIIEEVNKDGGSITPSTVKRCAFHIEEFIKKGGKLDV